MKHIQRKRSISSAFVLIPCLIFFVTSHAVAQSEDHLKAHEPKAEAIASLPENLDDKTNASEDNLIDNAAEKQKAVFETELQKSLPNTYTINRKLPADNKAIMVETFYLNEMKMPVASRQIFNFYFNDRKN